MNDNGHLIEVVSEEKKVTKKKGSRKERSSFKERPRKARSNGHKRITQLLKEHHKVVDEDVVQYCLEFIKTLADDPMELAKQAEEDSEEAVETPKEDETNQEVVVDSVKEIVEPPTQVNNEF